jgi:hypothetical protein
MSTIIWILEQISDHMTNVEQISRFAHKTWVIHYHIIPILEGNRHNHITHTQRQMNNAWSEIMSSFPCFSFYCYLFIYLFILWFIFIPTLWHDFHLIVCHVSSITFLLTTSNLMLCLLHSKTRFIIFQGINRNIHNNT